MENSFVGPVDAQFLRVSLKRITPSDSHKHMWVEQSWAWYGQDTLPVDGSCRSALYDKDGYVVAFFQYLSDDTGIGIGVAAQELLHMGYSLHIGIKG